MFGKLVRMLSCGKSSTKKRVTDPNYVAPDKIGYYLNDPYTPNLITYVNPPEELGILNYYVEGYHGPGFPLNSNEGKAANCHVTIHDNLQYLSTIPFSKRPERWAASKKLRVFPLAGKDLNAFYDRRTMKFFFENSYYTCLSADIIRHETGHAILDAIRPDFWNLQSLEIWAFHEAFGDINAIVGAMQYGPIIDAMISETGGDLRKSNLVSKLAEKMGQILYQRDTGLRNAVNDFKYEYPETLPQNAPEDKLAAECHSFGRVFVGAWYDMMVAIYEHCKKETNNSKLALIKACDESYCYLLEALQIVPATVRFYDAMSKAILAIDKGKGGKYKEIIREAFKERHILKEPIKMLSYLNSNEVQKGIDLSKDVLYKPHNGTVIKTSNVRTLSLSDHLKGALIAQSHSELYDVQIETPGDSYYEFDNEGNLIEAITPSTEEIVESAHACIRQIEHQEMLGDDEDTMFEIAGGKLIRTLIKCGGNNG